MEIALSGAIDKSGDMLIEKLRANGLTDEIKLCGALPINLETVGYNSVRIVIGYCEVRFDEKPAMSECGLLFPGLSLE